MYGEPLMLCRLLKRMCFAAMAVLAATIVGSVALAQTDADKALDKAIRSGDLKAAKQAVAQGADVNYQGALPLYIAAQYGRFEMVKILVDAGANINGLMVHGPVATPLRVVIGKANDSQSYDMVDYLLSLGADPAAGGIRMRSPLTVAVRTRRLEQVKKVVRGGKADFEYKESYSKPGDAYGKTALMIAVELGFVPIVEYLVGQGADINNSRSCGETALYYAAFRGHVEIVALLLRLGAEANPKKIPERCRPKPHPLLGAASLFGIDKEKEAMAIYRLLLEAGADPEAGWDPSYEFRGPINFAISYCNAELFALLVKYGAPLRDRAGEVFEKKCGVDPLPGATVPAQQGAK